MDPAFLHPEPGQASSGRPGLHLLARSPRWSGSEVGWGAELQFPGICRQDGVYSCLCGRDRPHKAASFQIQTQWGGARRVSEDVLL